jgi:glycine betaine/proline transport system substrate-binding protein
MKNNQIDLFLDNWMPAEAATRKHYLEQKAIDVVRADLTGAKYTLVVPAYLYKEGLKSFSDIHKFAGRLHHRIYGIDPGSGGNVLIEKMLKAKAFDLGDFHLVQSSSAGMLAEVKRRYDKKQAIVFLGWEPHPMNIEFDIKYLSGGAKYFGPHQGAATVYIVTRHGYAQDCPNLGALLNNFRLDVHAENKMMYAIQVKGEKPAAVARTWLAAHPAWIKTTLDGVTTTDGKPAAAAAPAASGQGLTRSRVRHERRAAGGAGGDAPCAAPHRGRRSDASRPSFRYRLMGEYDDTIEDASDQDASGKDVSGKDASGEDVFGKDVSGPARPERGGSARRRHAGRGPWRAGCRSGVRHVVVPDDPARRGLLGRQRGAERRLFNGRRPSRLHGDVEHLFGADHLCRAEGQPGRSVPRQLDAGAEGDARSLRQAEGDRRHRAGPDRRQIHARRARLSLRQGPQDVRRHP